MVDYFCFNFQAQQTNHGVESIHYAAFSTLNPFKYLGLLSDLIQSWVQGKLKLSQMDSDLIIIFLGKGIFMIEFQDYIDFLNASKMPQV